LDYTNSTCPKLLLEPQRTNLLLYSEQFDNGYWAKDPSASVVANAAISPDGTQNADRLNFAAAGNAVYRASLGLSGAHRFTVYLKGEGANIGKQIYLEIGNASGSVNVTLSGEWQRFTAIADGTASVAIKQLNSSQANAVLAWGAQLELGTYATSYVKTEAVAVTRVADAGTTSIPSLVNASEGVLFLDYTPNNIVDAFPVDFQLQFSGTNAVNGVTIFHSGSVPSASVKSGGVTVASFAGTSVAAGASTKVAIAYKANDFAMYQNGILIGTDTSGAAPISLNELRLSDGPRHFSIKQALVFKTRLTNAQLAELTTL
jgi:hypothetical protein